MAGFTRYKAHRSVKFNNRPVLPTAKPDNRQWETDMGSGFTRVDNGAPPARLPCETQPVSVGELEGPAVAPPVLPVTIEPAPTSELTTRKPQSANWQREFGLGRRD